MIIFFGVFCLFFFGNWFYLIYSLILLLLLIHFYGPLLLNYRIIGFYFDTLRFSLLYLVFFIFILIYFSSQFIYKFSFFLNYYMFFLLSLIFFLFFSFLTRNFLIFYFSFESSLIPTFALILGWGLQPERLQASIYFFFYTLFISIPLLFVIFYLHGLSTSFSFLFISGFNRTHFILNFFFILLILMAFLIKMPLFIFHLWLPKAHVEAPVRGSMILAGILLKLGGYGICRVIHVVINFISLVSPYLFSLRLIRTILVGLFCCRLRDIKALVAYSSVAHIGLLVCSLLSYFTAGFIGSLMVIVSHGITSSGLFIFINVIYERVRSRNLFLRKGLISVFPSLGLIVFSLCSSNFSTPPFVSLLSEIFLMFSIINYSFLIFFLFPVGSFLGTVFSIYLFSFSQHGLSYSISFNLKSINLLELHTLFLHIMGLVLLPFIIFFFLGYY